MHPDDSDVVHHSTNVQTVRSILVRVRVPIAARPQNSLDFPIGAYLMTSIPTTSRLRRTAGACALVALLATGSVLEAQSFRTSWKPVDAPAEIVVRDGVVEMALEDAIAIALAQNLGLRIQRFERAQALFNIEERRSIYDLNANSTLSLSEETQPSASQLDGADIRQSETTFWRLGLDQLVPTGGVASVDWVNTRSESNSVFAQINPSFSVGFDLLFSQPLLRGFGRDNTERSLRLARLDAAISLESLELQVADTIQNVENAYWTLVETQEQLAVSEESLALTQQLHEMNKIQVEVGTKAPLELITSEARIASDQEAIIRNRAAVQDAADNLRQLLNLQGDDVWAASIVATTPPETERIEIDLMDSLSVAQRERRELEIQNKTLERLEIDSRFFDNQKLPDLSLDLRYGFNGLGGDILVLDPGTSPFDPNPSGTTISGGYSDALRQVTDMDFEGWSVGLSVSYAIQNRSARALSTIADLALEQGRLQYSDTALGIRTEVRQSARAVETAAEQIDSARASRRLEEKNLEAQQKRYENGLATSFQVLEVQEDLTAAKERVVRAITGYRRALTQYYKAIGRLLEVKGIELEDETDVSGLGAE